MIISWLQGLGLSHGHCMVTYMTLAPKVLILWNIY